MGKVRIPLIGVSNVSGLDAHTTVVAEKDQRFVNCAFEVVKNPVTGNAVGYVEKRPGWKESATISANNASTGLYRREAMGSVISAFGETNSTIFDSNVSVGTITGLANYFTETIINGVAYCLIRSSDGTGWYYPSGARTTLTYTCDGNNSTTISDIKVGGVNSVDGLYVGQKLSAATNIAAGSRIESINAGAFTAVLSLATTGGAFNDLAVTKEPIAKITDADFKTTGKTVTALVEMDGFHFYANEDGYIYQSDANSVVAYTSTAKIPANSVADVPIALTRVSSFIVALGENSVEFFRNAGNDPATCVLARSQEYMKRTGILHQRSMARLGDDWFFVTSTRSGDIGVVKMRGADIQQISTPRENRLLGTLNNSGCRIYASAFTMGGQSYLTLVATNESGYYKTESDGYYLMEDGISKYLLEGDESAQTTFSGFLVYNITLNVWCEWDSTLLTYIIGSGASSTNQLFATSRINKSGKIYRCAPTMDGDIYQDDGADYSMTIRTSLIDNGSPERKFTPRIWLHADTEDAGTVTLERLTNGYKSTVTLGTFDLTKDEKRLDRCGSYEGACAYRLTHSHNGHFRASALEIEYE